MHNWHHGGAVGTNECLQLPDIRSFHDSARRAFEGMRRSQACAKVLLDPRYFGVPHALDEVWCCKVADNTAPRLCCRNRELVFVPSVHGVLLVDPRHGGKWWSRPLVYSFLVGLEDKEVPPEKHICRCSLGLRCAGKKADAHWGEAGKRKKKKRNYDYYENDGDSRDFYECA